MFVLIVCRLLLVIISQKIHQSKNYITPSCVIYYEPPRGGLKYFPECVLLMHKQQHTAYGRDEPPRILETVGVQEPTPKAVALNLPDAVTV